MAGAVVVTTPCKVNLHLGVHREKDERGYHRVDSVMVPVDLCDVVTVERAPALSVRFEPSLEVAPERTGVWKAAVLLAEALGRQPGVSVSVTCHIPERAGLGGILGGCGRRDSRPLRALGGRAARPASRCGGASRRGRRGVLPLPRAGALWRRGRRPRADLPRARGAHRAGDAPRGGWLNGCRLRGVRPCRRKARRLRRPLLRA